MNKPRFLETTEDNGLIFMIKKSMKCEVSTRTPESYEFILESRWHFVSRRYFWPGGGAICRVQSLSSGDNKCLSNSCGDISAWTKASGRHTRRVWPHSCVLAERTLKVPLFWKCKGRPVLHYVAYHTISPLRTLSPSLALPHNAPPPSQWGTGAMRWWIVRSEAGGRTM